MIGKIFNFFKEDRPREIVERSNVIQYDHMGYPLRLVIMDDEEQVWLDTEERVGDVVLRWSN